MKKTFTVIIERDEDGIYIAKIPALKGCHTQAKNYDELITRVKEVIELCLETEDLEDIPDLSLEGVHRFEVSL